MKIYYCGNHIEIRIPVYPIPGFHPTFEIKSYWNYKDIPESIIKELSQDDIEGILWFFLDLEYPIEQ
jgi:hypothetical protein